MFQLPQLTLCHAHVTSEPEVFAQAEQNHASLSWVQRKHFKVQPSKSLNESPRCYNTNSLSFVFSGFCKLSKKNPHTVTMRHAS